MKTLTRRASEGVFLLASLMIAFTGCGQFGPKPLSGTLTVLVRPPDRTLEPVPVDQPGATPVQSAGAMCLDANLDEPAFIYILWIDPEGKVLPLYPWNNAGLEVTDVNTPPPVRRAGKLVFSPMLGNSWTFGDKPGVETVVLLARRTALPEKTRLGELLGSSPAPQSASAAQQVVEVRLDARTKRGTKNAKAKDAALVAFLAPLNEHFDLIHAVQFTHGSEDGKSGGEGER